MLLSPRSLLPLATLLALAVALGCDGAPDPDDAGGGADTGAPDAGEPDPFRPECENLNPTHCLVPWPSSYFLTEDGDTSTGFRVDIPVDAMPANNSMETVDPGLFDRFDGFSPATSLFTSFPGMVDPAGLNGEDDIAASLDPSSTTVIVDAETSELVAHFAEFDSWPNTDPERAPIYLRPAARLEEGRRYVVGIQGLTLVGGGAVEPSEYFAALRDGTALDGTDVEDRRAHFEEIFGVLDDAGVARGDLIEAWDFVTASGEAIWGDLIAMRDDAVGTDEVRSGGTDFGRMGEDGLGCTIDQVVDVDDGGDLPEPIWRRVDGTITVPLYLEGDDPGVETSRIHRGADGAPENNGTAEVPFTLMIPLSVRDRVLGAAPDAAAPALEIYGHGLFGSRAEVTYGWHRDHIDNLKVVSAGVDWWGMSEPDLGRIAQTLQEFSSFDATGERLTQSVVNVLALTRALRGSCAGLDAFQVPMGDGSTRPSYDPDHVYYYGNSQGGIMGGVVAGVAVDIERFVLGVGA